MSQLSSPTQQAGLVSCAPPPTQSHEEHFEENRHMHVSGESTICCFLHWTFVLTQKGKQRMDCVAVNTTVTVVQLLLCAGHGTRPFLRQLQTLTVLPHPPPQGPLTSLLLQMQKPSRESARTSRATSQWGRSRARSLVRAGFNSASHLPPQMC